MPVYKYGSPDYCEAMTSRSIDFSRVAAKEAGYQLGAILMGNDGENAPVAILLEMHPNDVLPRHGHDTHRVEIVIRGSVILADGRVATPGDVLVTPAGDLYGPHTAGPEGVLTAEIFASATGLLPKNDPNEADPAILESFEHARKTMTEGLTAAGLL